MIKDGGPRRSPLQEGPYHCGCTVIVFFLNDLLGLFFFFFFFSGEAECLTARRDPVAKGHFAGLDSLC